MYKAYIYISLSRHILYINIINYIYTFPKSINESTIDTFHIQLYEVINQVVAMIMCNLK